MIPLIGAGGVASLLAGVAIYLCVQYSTNHSTSYWRLVLTTIALMESVTVLLCYLIASSPDWFQSHSSKFNWEHWPFGGPLHVLLVTTVIGWSCAAGWGFLNKK